jgi:stearoyl-CoA desaturase (Delta-9 desaturase)
VELFPLLYYLATARYATGGIEHSVYPFFVNFLEKELGMELTAGKNRIKWPVVFVIPAFHILGLCGFLYLFSVPWQINLIAFTVYCFGGLSVTHLHRLLVHSNVQKLQISPAVAYWTMFWFAGSFQGIALGWGEDHLDHHRFSEIPGEDTHSPKDGAWWAHMGWLFVETPRQRTDNRWRRLRRADTIGRALAWEQKYHWPLVVCTLFIMPAFIGWLWGDLLGGLLVITFFRLLVQWQVTWSVNSKGHNANLIFPQGKKPIGATNYGGLIMALLSFGESLHGNHHSDGEDWRFGKKPSDGDVGGWVISLFIFLGLAFEPKQA